MTGNIVSMARICLCALPLLAIVRRSWRRPGLREIIVLLFLTWMTGLLALALDGTWRSPGLMLEGALERIRTGERINLTPLRTILRQLRKLPTSPELQLTQLLGNTLMFIPWGFCLPLLWPRLRKPLRIVLLCLALTCGIELLQLFIRREVDVDDVLLNFLGSMMGAGLWAGLRRFIPPLVQNGP